jgi:predicted AAA+ superfamily ATPase
MIKRKLYFKLLRELRDKRLIKVVTGVRRCGKSTLLEMFSGQLLQSGVEEPCVIFINFEDPAYNKNLDWRFLYDELNSKLVSDKMNYIFLDEIQNVPEFERLADGLFIKKNVDLYITGSNAFMLSSELATLLSGRYVEIKMLPLSFSEYVSAFQDRSRLDLLFNDYVRLGSFPYVTELPKQNSRAVDEYLAGICNTVIIKDVVTRKSLNNPGRVVDTAKFVFDNIGSLVTYKKIADAMSSGGRNTDSRTIETYLNALEESFIIYPAAKFDLKGKKLLRTQKKYYVVDTGLRRAILGGDAFADIGRAFENIVYLELLRRGLTVFIGKTGDKEIDFIARRSDGEVLYYQVAYTAKEQSTLDRELASLRSVKDNHRKFLITGDVEPVINFDGIEKINLVEWLLSESDIAEY